MNMDEKEWKRRYIKRLMDWNISKKDAEEDGNAAEVDLSIPPEEAADDEVSYMEGDVDDGDEIGR